MAEKYKDHVISWCFRAAWTLEEAAIILHEGNPETLNIKFNPTSSDRMSVTYFWLKKQLKAGLLPPATDDNKYFTPGEICRAIRGHTKQHSVLVSNLALATSKGRLPSNTHRIISWRVYEKTYDYIQSKYPNLSKAGIVRALRDLHIHYDFPDGMPLSPYAYETLLRKFRNRGSKKSGRIKNEHSVEIDISQIAEEIRI